MFIDRGHPPGASRAKIARRHDGLVTDSLGTATAGARTPSFSVAALPPPGRRRDDRPHVTCRNQPGRPAMRIPRSLALAFVTALLFAFVSTASAKPKVQTDYDHS